jgi:secreted trypsin-like serine protease
LIFVLIVTLGAPISLEKPGSSDLHTLSVENNRPSIMKLQGDSGGPFVRIENGQPALHGIEILGSTCNNTKKEFTVALSVPQYLQWIRQNMN